MTDNDDRIKLEASWKEALREEFDKPYMKQLGEFLRQEKAAGKAIFPPGPLIFNALNTTPLENVKVVIIGQDPRPTACASRCSPACRRRRPCRTSTRNSTAT